MSTPVPYTHLQPACPAITLKQIYAVPSSPKRPKLFVIHLLMSSIHQSLVLVDSDSSSPRTGRWGGRTAIHMSIILREGSTTMKWPKTSSAARSLKQGKILST